MLGLAVFCFLPLCLSQVIVPSPCPDVTLQPAFDLTQYVGKWYQQDAYPFRFEGNGTCVTAEYTPLGDGSVQVNNTVFDLDLQAFRSDIGNAVVADPDNPAELCVKFQQDQPCGDYRVLSTDYTGYTLIHSCAGLSASSIQVNWILTRDPNPLQEVVDQARQIAESQGIDVSYFEPTPQNCGN